MHALAFLQPSILCFAGINGIFQESAPGITHCPDVNSVFPRLTGKSVMYEWTVVYEWDQALIHCGNCK